ncbi:hypothetical protein ANCCAN_15738 [Ancylostoma caninum]|uniref:Uncharacterized protein n=1 Tax=Ancylostoma caninum TaxID=29170 RepID=A0A368G4X4_ANCCA|nr:hypothetical protein ANCCAN_15738 [Ancylostoma caninum]
MPPILPPIPSVSMPDVTKPPPPIPNIIAASNPHQSISPPIQASFPQAYPAEMSSPPCPSIPPWSPTRPPPVSLGNTTASTFLQAALRPNTTFQCSGPFGPPINPPRGAFTQPPDGFDIPQRCCELHRFFYQYPSVWLENLVHFLWSFLCSSTNDFSLKQRGLDFCCRAFGFVFSFFIVEAKLIRCSLIVEMFSGHSRRSRLRCVSKIVNRLVVLLLGSALTKSLARAPRIVVRRSLQHRDRALRRICHVLLSAYKD